MGNILSGVSNARYVRASRRPDKSHLWFVLAFGLGIGSERTGRNDLVDIHNNTYANISDDVIFVYLVIYVILVQQTYFK